MSVQVADLRRSEREREGCADGSFRSHPGTGGRTETGLSPGVSTRRFVAHNSALLIRDIPPNVTPITRLLIPREVARESGMMSPANPI